MSRPTAFNLNHKITIMQDVSTSGAPNWQPLFSNVFAAKQGLSERLFFGAAATQSEDFSTFIIHYSKDYIGGIRPTMRVKDGSDDDLYEIVGTPVDIYDDRRWLKIHAKRNVT